MLTIDDVLAAADRIAPDVRRTPVITNGWLDELTGYSLFFKCENLQITGSFKLRGALNAVASLTELEASRGVVTHSSGNHAAALAYAAKLHGLPIEIVVPNNISAKKLDTLSSSGAKVTKCAPTIEARAAGVADIMARTGAAFIPPFDHIDVMAGQGTAMLEMSEEVSDLDVVIVPVSGGGLISGTAVAAKHAYPSISVFGAEPSLADDAARSFATGDRQGPTENTNRTIADGLRGCLGIAPFEIIRSHVSGFHTATEQEIVAAMREFWEQTNLIIEPSSAVPIAAVMRKAFGTRGLRVAVILSGGNVDLDRLPWQL